MGGEASHSHGLGPAITASIIPQHSSEKKELLSFDGTFIKSTCSNQGPKSNIKTRAIPKTLLFMNHIYTNSFACGSEIP